MMEIEIFKNERFGEIRVAGSKENPLFCAADLCKALEYSNSRDAIIKHVDSEDVAKCDTPTQSGIQSMVYVNESGLYSLIFGSKMRAAKEFKRWVCEEVLPSIRKHGIYATDDTIEQILNNPDFGIKLLTTLKEERIARVEAERRNAILMHVNTTYTATEIAKELNMKSAKQLNRALADKKVQYKVGNTWVFYSKYSDKGYEEIKQETLDNGKVVYHRKFTQLGRDFILNLFKIN